MPYNRTNSGKTISFHQEHKKVPQENYNYKDVKRLKQT